MNDTSLEQKVHALHATNTYGSAANLDVVTSIETHFAWVFLIGKYAYKLKKPVHIERMDFRELAARERNCREELRLNQRLAPDVYLHVVALTRDDAGRFAIEGRGAVIEWLVKMRRLPAHRMLDCAIASGTAVKQELESVAQLLAQFYRDQIPALVSATDYLARIHAHVDTTLAELSAHDFSLSKELLKAAHQQQTSFLEKHAALIQARAADGRIVEGHGDLRPEHIFLGDDAEGATALSPCIIDCLEFDRDLRITDPLEELAFLALECARLQSAWVGKEFIDIYCAVADDEMDSRLFTFYRAERALNRAKIAAWHLRDPAVSGLADWRALATSYLEAALQPA